MMQNRVQFRDMAADLFKKMDASGFGQITINEFESLYDDEDMKAFLDSIEISASDAWTLFASLDQDGNGLIGINEFTEGCLKTAWSGAFCGLVCSTSAAFEVPRATYIPCAEPAQDHG